MGEKVWVRVKKTIRGLVKKIWENILIGIGIVGIVFFLADFLFSWGFLRSKTYPTIPMDPGFVMGPTLAEVITFFGAIISLSLFFKRIKNQEEQLQKQEKQIKLQIDQRVDDRFTTAVNLLGSDKTSARAGAIYSLYQLAVEDEKYRAQIAQILCSHVRSRTNEPEYQDRHKDRPSDEIQTTINLLVRDDNNTRGLYCQDFWEELPRADFTHAYLVGADLLRHSARRQIFSKHSARGQIFSRQEDKMQILIMHSVRGQILIMHSARGQILKMHSVREQIFRGTVPICMFYCGILPIYKF